VTLLVSTTKSNGLALYSGQPKKGKEDDSSIIQFLYGIGAVL
jgi:hypothetical protein